MSDDQQKPRKRLSLLQASLSKLKNRKGAESLAHQDDTPESTPSSGFLRLPTETRLIIYRFVWCSERAERLHAQGNPHGHRPPYARGSLHGQSNEPVVNLCCHNNPKRSRLVDLLSYTDLKRSRRPNEDRTSPARLLRICRLCHAEAMPLLYQALTFGFHCSTLFDTRIALRRLGEVTMKRVRNVKVEIPVRVDKSGTQNSYEIRKSEETIRQLAAMAEQLPSLNHFGLEVRIKVVYIGKRALYERSTC